MIGRALFTSAAAAGAVAVAVYLYRCRKGAPTPASVASTPGRKTKALKEIRRVDYTTPPINIESVRLVAKLDEPNASTERGKAVSIIETALGCYYNPSVPESELVLHAEDMDVLEVAVSHQGKVKSILSPGRDYVYDAEAETLTIQRAALVGNGSDVFTLHTVVAIDPEANKQLQGLFKSSGIFCTQMEAEGYRRMTPHLDRPDVLSVYTVRIEADAGSCPVLLSNGNRTGAGTLPNGRHFAEYHDPFPKPSYLFALVAGRLGVLRGQFTTAWAKREVTLNIYTEPECVDQLEFGMACIQKAMRWDEEQFGREYDLDVFNIVAVADFNMGAMENKGLNIFNSKYVLGMPSTATDATLRSIQGVIAHEYFHNWTGNRVTCRDWFQLTLKEGLTVFRDIRFTSDASDATVKRINDVRMMREQQFPEDGGPMAHPIRPESYVKMDNFYTKTVYRKGSEVIRLYETLLGRDGFRNGMDLYFERHDGQCLAFERDGGQAVTCDDFRAAMADANDSDAIRTAEFGRWYSQAGTPTLTVVAAGRNSASGDYELTLSQATEPTPGQPDKLPLLLPVAVGVLVSTGEDTSQATELQLRHKGTAEPFVNTLVLQLTQPMQTFVLELGWPAPSPAETAGAKVEAALPAADQRITLSVLRGWSAPVKLVYTAQDSTDLATLMAHDSDGFNRYEAASRFATKVLVTAAEELAKVPLAERVSVPTPSFDAAYLAAWGSLFDAADTFAAAGEPHLHAKMLTLPTEVELLNEMSVYDAHAVHTAIAALRLQLAASRANELLPAYRKARVPPSDPYALTPIQEGRRALAATLLSYAAAIEGALEAVASHYQEATNMTDASAALGIIASMPCEAVRQRVLDDFEKKWKGNRDVMDTWFTVQAVSSLPGAASRLRMLMQHEAFSLTNPNKVRAVVGCLQLQAPSVLFTSDVLELVGEIICAVDATNGNLAASLCKMLQCWRKLPSPLQQQAKAVLERVQRREGCSKNAGEVAATALK